MIHTPVYAPKKKPRRRIEPWVVGLVVLMVGWAILYPVLHGKQAEKPQECLPAAPVVTSLPAIVGPITVNIDGQTYALVPVRVVAVVPGKSGAVVLEVKAGK